MKSTIETPDWPLRRPPARAGIRPRRVALSLLLASVLGVSAAPAVLGAEASRLGDPALAAQAFEVEVGGALRLEEVALFPGEDASTLDLRRVRVFRADARILVHGTAGDRLLPLPARAHFAGTVAGEPDSFALLAVGAAGDVQGLVIARGPRFAIAPDPLTEPPPGSPGAARPGVGRGGAVRPIAAGGAATAPAGAICAAGELPDLESARAAPRASAGRPQAPAAGPGLLAAEVAVETDWELFDALGSTAAVTAYVSDLFAAASAVYQRDVSTALEIGFLSLWETPADPFTVTTGFLDALFELGDYWHAEHLATPRTLTHFLSGKAGLQGGIAYHGVLCSPDVLFQGHWAGGYSLTGALVGSGSFRDTFIMAHELGHNFRSHHTHCYNDLPAAGDPPIDHCFSGEIRNDGHPCYSGPTALPPDGGSIMSYCHLLPGGYQNVTLALGEKGSFGERSDRVLQRMIDHIGSVGCLVPAGGTIFADGFESGDLTAWTGSTP